MVALFRASGMPPRRSRSPRQPSARASRQLSARARSDVATNPEILVPRVRFAHRSAAARVDVYISSLLAAVRLGPLEYVLLLPAHAFGAPLVSLCIIPCVLPLLCGSTDAGTGLLAIAGVFLGGVLPLFMCAMLERPPTIFHKGPHVGVAAVGSLVGSRWLSVRAFQLHCVYLLAWLVVTAVCWLAKGWVSRLRPAAVLAGAQHLLRTGDGDDDPSAHKSTRSTDASPSSPPPPLPSSRDAFESRRARWPRLVNPHSALPNATHSMPSFDTACAACFGGLVLLCSEGGTAPPATLLPLAAATTTRLVCLLVALVAYGRIYFFAHHLLDVLTGAAIGGATAWAAATCVPLIAGGWALLWLAACPIALRALCTAKPATMLVGLGGLAALTFVAPHQASLVGIAVFGGVASSVTLVFNAQARAVKPAVLTAVQAAWAAADAACPASGLLPPALVAGLHRKRQAFIAQAADPASTFPGNVFLMCRFYQLPFLAGWEELRGLLARRLDDWAATVKVDLASIDVVLGVHSGGACKRKGTKARARAYPTAPRPAHCASHRAPPFSKHS